MEGIHYHILPIGMNMMLFEQIEMMNGKDELSYLTCRLEYDYE